MWYIGMYTSEGTLFLWICFHLMQNVYHKPGLPAAGHLIFADSPHCRFLPHPSVKSREQTQSKFSLLQKAGFFFLFFLKTIFGNTFKILCSLPWIQGPAPRMESLHFHLNLSPLPPVPQAWLDPKDFCLFPEVFCTLVQFSLSVMCNSFLYHGIQYSRFPCPSPTPRSCSDSCSSGRWCHPTVSSSVFPFAFCL